jgi:hypothetical protein
VKIGHLVRYRADDLAAYVAGQRRDPATAT